MQDRLDAIEFATLESQLAADFAWILIAAALVLCMQVGFLLLEAGLARSKNSINVAQKNVADFLLAVVCFSVLGFGLTFGPDLGGGIGNPLALSAFTLSTPWLMAFFVFQAMFVGTAATIVSGAVAERMTFSAYLLITVVISALIYPVFGHWAWGGAIDAARAGWLGELGFIDFAGSTVVHSVGGWVALAGLIRLGPRAERFDAAGAPRQLASHSIVLAAAGAMILFVGWIGFNGGSTLSASPAIAGIIANTVIAGAFGGTAALALGRLADGLYMPTRMINGTLGGLVAITAGCAVVEPASAALIGAFAGAIVIAAEDVLLRRFKLDDVVGAVAVHGVGGAVGTLLAALFAAPEHLAAGSRWAQFAVQAIGVGAAFVWAFGAGVLAFKVIDLLIGVRISAEEERRGLNVSEHGVTLGTGALQEALRQVACAEAKAAKLLDDSSGDEAAEIAAVLNPLIEEMQTVIASVSSELAASDGELRRAMAELVEARNRAEAANTAKSQFIANMSHELRTPLNAVIGYAEMLLEDAEADKNAAAAVDLQRIIDAAGHLLGLINEILDLAKIEAGQIQFTCEPFDPRALVEQVVNLVRPQAQRNNTEISWSVEGPLRLAHTDQDKLRQALTNLAANACKFTEGGTVQISFRRRIDEGADWLEFEVRDSGIGIAPEQLANLFRPFVQADASITRRFGGTGLGLSITRKLAQALGGDVEVSSALGRGSVFTLRAPAIHSAAASEPGALQPSDPARAGRGG